MGGRRLGTVPAAVGALTLLAATAAPAGAARPVEDVYRGTGIDCTYAGEDGLLRASTFFDPAGALLEGWAEAETADLWAWAYEGTGTLAAGSFATSFLLTDESAGAAGVITVEGALEPVGEPAVIDERTRDGNAWNASRGTVQPLLGTATVSSATGDLAQFEGVELACFGAEVDLVFTGTNPATRVFHREGVAAQCALGEDGFLVVDSFGTELYGLVALGIDWETGEAAVVAEGSLMRDGQSITGTLAAVFPPPAGEPDTVEVDLTVGEAVGHGKFRDRWRQGGYHERYTEYLLDGSVTAPDGTVMTLEGCVLRTFTSVERYSSRAGQKPGGPAPVNDAPAGALPVDLGSTVRAGTRGALEQPEAECELPEVGPLPWGRTLWYSFEGTGEVVTVSTEGSGFDTVVGVYAAGTFEQVACGDDTPEGLQASVRVPTEEGAVYLVQVGGFFADFGRLVLTVG